MTLQRPRGRRSIRRMEKLTYLFHALMGTRQLGGSILERVNEGPN